MSQENQENAATELVLAFRLLLRRLRSEAPSVSSELSWTQVGVMKRLDSDGPATTADLARAEGVKPQSMGTVVAGLEALGMVQRMPHATDGRQVHIALTEKGAAIRNDVRLAKQTWLAQAIAKLDAEEQADLAVLTKLIKRLAGL